MTQKKSIKPIRGILQGEQYAPYKFNLYKRCVRSCNSRRTWRMGAGCGKHALPPFERIFNPERAAFVA